MLGVCVCAGITGVSDWGELNCHDKALCSSRLMWSQLNDFYFN